MMFYLIEIMVRTSSFKHDRYKINTSDATVKLVIVEIRYRQTIMEDCQSVQVARDRSVKIHNKLEILMMGECLYSSHQDEDVLL